MSPKHFLNFQKITKQEMVSIIDRGLELKKSVKPKKTLKNKVLGLVFEQPSTRTRVSFEVGMLRLGGNSLFLSGNELQLSRGEPISDTAKVLSSMLDVIVLRTDDQEKLNIFSQNSSVPLINGLSDLYHPCQIMADLMTFREIMGDEQLEKVCWIGDGNNVCHSYMEAANLLGFELSIFCPSGYEPDSGILECLNQVHTHLDKIWIIQSLINLQLPYKNDRHYCHLLSSILFLIAHRPLFL